MNSGSSNNQLSENSRRLSSSKSASVNDEAKSAHFKVKETMKLYNKLFLEAVKVIIYAFDSLLHKILHYDIITYFNL